MNLIAATVKAATGCTQSLADLHTPHLAESCAGYDITTPERLAAYFAQLGHESGSLHYAREIASGAAYEGRADLGNTQPGDGERFRGRGWIQCTGRSNYMRARDALRAHLGESQVPDFEAWPEAMEQPKWSAWVSAWWWAAHGCNELADAGQFVPLGRLINRGNAASTKQANGEADRIERWERAKLALGASDQPTTADQPQAVPTPPPAPIEAPRADIPAEQPKGKPMAPIIAALLPSLISAIPKLGALFGSGSEVATRNVKAAEIAFGVAKEALGANNEQEVVERIQSDPAAVVTVAKAIEDNWFSLTDAGGGGIDGARKADAVIAASGDMLHSPSFWIAVLLLPLVYMIVANLIGVLGASTWSDDARAGLTGSIVGSIIGGVVGYYFGQTTSRNRSGPAS